MSQAARLREIIAILEARKHPTPREVLLDELGVSLATLKRDLTLLRDQFHAPIKWLAGEDGKARGYILEDMGWSSGKLGLPRAWFTSSEIYALLMIDTLAGHIAPGLLTEHLQPLITRITMALSATSDDPENIRAKVRLLASSAKRKDAPHFESVAQATVRKQRLEIEYFTKSRNETSTRTISPQRLVHYKENWYLVAWCHRADALRVFSLDGVRNAVVLNDKAVEVEGSQVEAAVGKDFGIISGATRHWARLQFSVLQTRWIESEIWHPEQRLFRQPDESLILEIPFSDPRELVLDILKYGPEVKVLEPKLLRDEVCKRLQKALLQYQPSSEETILAVPGYLEGAI